MKNFYLLIPFLMMTLLGIAQTQTEFPETDENEHPSQMQKVQKTMGYANKSIADFCIPEGMNCTDGDGIHGFALESINNMSSACSDNGYGDFTNLSTDLAQGNNYNIIAYSGYGSNMLTVWIDFNDNDIFDEGEKIVEGNELLVNENTTIPINIPFDANTGEHRLRATAVYQNNSPDPCEVYNYGECEDYTVNIIAPNYKDVAVLSIEMDDALPLGSITPMAKVAVLGTQTGSFEVTMVDGESYSSTISIDNLGFGQSQIVEFDTYTPQAGNYTF